MSRRSQRVLLVVLAVVATVGCGNTNRISVTVLTPPDADPWRGPDAADFAMITLLNGSSAPQRVPVTNGAFSFQVEPASPSEQSRLEIQAERGTQVVGTGITPVINWASGGHDVTVLVQPPDSIVAAPGGGLSAARGSPQLLVQFPGFFAVSVDPGSASMVPSGYDTIGNVPASFTETVPSWCDDHCIVMPIVGGWLLSRGQQPGSNCTSPMQPQQAWYDGNGSASSQAVPNTITVPARRCDYDDSTVVVDTVNAGGVWLVGGRHRGAYITNGTGAMTTLAGRVGDVDTFTSSSQATVSAQNFLAQPADAPLSLLVPRAAPQVVILQQPMFSTSEPINTEWLVGGGQDLGVSPRPALLELFSPAATSGRSAVALPDALNDRDQISLVCAATSSSGACTLVLALGGSDVNGVVVNDDLVLDGTCLASGNCATPLLAHRPLLQHARRGARAVYAEGGAIVIAGGYDATGPVYDIESIDVSMASGAMLPAQGHVVATLPCANPAVAALGNGTVAIVGGIDAQQHACNDVYFYRR